MLGAFIMWGKEPTSLRRWTGPARPPHRWTVLTWMVGLIPLPIFILNIHLLADPTILVLWIAFALINPWFEEGYWRGLLLDVTAQWPPWLGNTYSTLLFIASHPLLWGVFSVANRDWMPLVALFLMGMTWATAYRRAGTLRWTIASHILVDMGNLAMPVFLNLYIPPHL